jgi:glycosyltransferase involved in cell wall biosynthesis
MLGRGFGGAERSFVDTALALAESGHEVLAICHSKFVKKELLENVTGITLKTVNTFGEWDFIAPLTIRKMLNDFRAEVVHTQLKRAAWHAGRAAGGLGLPVVSKLHNYVDLHRYKYVDVLIGTTEDQKRHALLNGWHADRVVVIPNFSRICPVDAVTRGFSCPVRFISYGRYVKKKGFDILLNAFSKVLDAGIDATLTIGGRGPELENLKKISSELGIEGNVVLGEWIEDVSTALDDSDIFVLPSLDEPFGIAFLEAMARGKPIISTLTQGPSQVLTANEAYLVEIGSVQQLADAMIEASNNEGASLDKASNALTLYKDKYHQNAVIPQLVSIYESLISSS